MMNIEERVMKVMVSEGHGPRVSQSDLLVEDLEIDSLDMLNLINALEDELSCEITMESAKHWVDVEDIVETITKQCGEKLGAETEVVLCIHPGKIGSRSKL